MQGPAAFDVSGSEYSDTAGLYSFTTLSVLGGGSRNRTPNALLTLKIDRFLKLIKHYPPLRLNYTFTTFLLALPLTVVLLTVPQDEVGRFNHRNSGTALSLHLC